jgi:hypothetical protein
MSSRSVMLKSPFEISWTIKAGWPAKSILDPVTLTRSPF